MASGGETFIASSIVGHCRIQALAVNLPPTKVSLQCKAVVPVRLKTCKRCDHVFRSKRKAERNSMKRTRAVESDSVKSTRKAKDKLHKACERASEIHERTLNRQEQNNVHGKHERVTRQ